MKSLLNFSILISVFLDSAMFSRKPVNVFLYYVFYAVFIVLFVASYKTIKLNKTFTIIFLIIAVTGLGNAFLNDESYLLIVKQLFAVGFSSFTFYLFIVYNNYEIKKIYLSYLNIAFWVCVIGLFQQFSHLVGFVYGYDYSYIFSYWRSYTTEYDYYVKINSIVSEPAHFAVATAPALFTALDRVFDNRNTFLSKRRSIIIIVVYILTGSVLAMMSFLVSLILLLFKYLSVNNFFKPKNIVNVSLGFVIMFLVLNFVYNIPFVKYRIDDSWDVIVSDHPEKNAINMNLSTFAIFSNYIVAKESFERNPIFGSGLGTHSANYDKYIGKYFTNEIYGAKVEINKDDGSTMFVRMLSELGIFGFMILFGFMIKNHIPFKKFENEYYDIWLLNWSILPFFIVRILRFGNYSLLGFFLFVFLYYFSFRLYKIKRIEEERLLSESTI